MRDDDNLQFYARMTKGMTMPTARARLLSIFEQLDRIHPKDGWKRTNQVRVTGVTGFDVLNQSMPGGVAAFFAMLMIVVGLVLLIACTNVASLLLARASSRSHEFAVRLSLGASRRRIIRHLLAESLLLCVLGSIAGLAVDMICAKLIDKIAFPLPIPIHPVISPDPRLLWYLLGAILVSALCCGLLPALRVVRRDPNQALKQEEPQPGHAVESSQHSGIRTARGVHCSSRGGLFVCAQSASGHLVESRLRRRPYDMGIYEARP